MAVSSTLCLVVAGLLMAALLALTAHLIRVSDQHSKALEAANRNMQDEIRERRLAEESLLAARRAAEEATHAKSDFLARMSHEIRYSHERHPGYGQSSVG
jgi:signal transduction histidine kinase